MLRRMYIVAILIARWFVMQYIHYGHKVYDPDLFVEPTNQEMFNKPKGGLWGSPVGAERGWKQWCEDESFRDYDEENAFIFELFENANVYQINCREDIEKLPLQKSILTTWLVPDFEAIRESGIDAIQYNLSADTKEDWNQGLYFALYGWDCDCILVLNKDAIKAL